APSLGRPDRRRRVAGQQGVHLLGHQVAAPGPGIHRRPRPAAGIAGPGRRRDHAPGARRGAAGPGAGGPRRADRGDRRAGGRAHAALGRRPSAVRGGSRRAGRPPGAGGGRPRRPGDRGLAAERGGRAGLRRHRARRRRTDRDAPGAPDRTGRWQHGRMTRLDYNALNDTIRYTMWSVFRVEPGRLGDDRTQAAGEATDFLKKLEDSGVVVRGVYDLAGLRADADYMVWWHAAEVEPLQAAYADLRRQTALGRASVPVWSQVAIHRPAEFNKSHVP